MAPTPIAIHNQMRMVAAPSTPRACTRAEIASAMVAGPVIKTRSEVGIPVAHATAVSAEHPKRPHRVPAQCLWQCGALGL